MVMPNSVRLIAAITGAVFFWLFVQIFRNPGTGNPTSKVTNELEEKFKDPMLDRESFSTRMTAPSDAP